MDKTELLDFVEEQGRRNAAFSLETMEILSRRAHTLLAMLLTGAGASGGVALSHWGLAGSATLVVGLGVASVWWFGLAAGLANSALPTREVRAPAGEGYVLLEHARGALTDYINQAQTEGESPADALTLLREGELRVLQETAAQYRRANAAVARVLDRVYRAAALTPLLALGSLMLLHWRP